MAQAAMMDTHEEFTKLVEAGLEEKAAEAVVKLHSRAQITDTVTKAEFNDFREDVSASFDKVEDRFDKVEKEIADVRTELKSEIADVEASLKSEISHVRTEIADVRTELKSDISDVRTELKSEIVGVKSDLKWMKGIGAAILAAVVIPMLTELL